MNQWCSALRPRTRLQKPPTDLHRSRSASTATPDAIRAQKTGSIQLFALNVSEPQFTFPYSAYIAIAKIAASTGPIRQKRQRPISITSRSTRLLALKV